MTWPKVIEQVAGALLMALILLDVFFTVLYARIGTGIISTRLARGTWLTVRALAKAIKEIDPAVFVSASQEHRRAA
jgi:lipid-binding SYLF domain-containing protein